MEPTLIIRHVLAGIQSYATASKATVKVARDPFDVLELFLTGPAGMLIVVHYAGCEAGSGDLGEGEAPYQEADELIEITIGTPNGPNTTKGLVDGFGGRPGLIERVSEVRKLMLSLVLPDDQTTLRRFKLRGCDPLTTPQGLSLAAYRIRFAIHSVVEVDADIELPELED